MKNPFAVPRVAFLRSRAAAPASMSSVLVPGAIGLYVVGRALSFYVGQDTFAALLMVAMGVGLSVGLWELAARTRRALALEAELSGLPQAPSEGLLDGLSPQLRDLLRARIEQSPTSSRGESITPYLVGLMVMLGLLGTLLGLFETLAGAGRALTASADVNALRSGLSGPMRGLTRSFGCSAAGVSASAMLGLAAALVRRREGSVLARAHAYANAALRQFSPLRSQALALQSLAEQGRALPQAASALELVGKQLGALSERWEAAHRSAAELQQKSLEAALAGLRSGMAKTAADAGQSLQAVLSQQVELLLQKSAQALAGHAQETARVLERELCARREGDAELRKGLGQELLAVRDQVAASTEAQAELVKAQIENLEQALGLRAAQQNEQLVAQRAEAAALVASLSDASRALVGRLDDDARTRQEEAGRLFDELAGRLDGAGASLARIAEGVGSQLSARMSAEQTFTARSGEAMTLLAEGGKTLNDALARQELAIEALLSGARQQLERSAEQSQEGARAALERLIDLSGAQAQRLVQLERELEASQLRQADLLGSQLNAHGERLGKALEGTGGLVQEAAVLLKASSIELSAVAETFATGVERQRDAADRWLESLGELEGAVERAGRGAAADALGDQLASTQEVFARQLQFQRELFEQLRNLRLHASGPLRGERDVSA